MFCQRFCIFGQTEEQWHDAWQKLAFDKVNGNIDQFLSRTKRLAQQLFLRDQSILIKLKQIFPEKADTWLVVHDLDAMCGYLKKLYSPYQQKLAKESAGMAQPPTSGATPFSQMKSDEDTYHMKVGVTTQKRVHFETDNSLEEAVEKLTTAVDNLTYQQE